VLFTQDLTSSVSLGKSCFTASPGLHQTPAVKQKKKVIKTDVTPLPDYRQMVTPALKVRVFDVSFTVKIFK